MSARQPIAEAIISCRNILFNDRTSENVLPCLAEVLANLDSITISSTRAIVQRCAAEAIDQIKGTKFLSAGRILNLIHNLPLDEGTEKNWDIDYFLSVELSTFLEHFEEIKSARPIALFVCKQIACRYLADSG